MTTYRTQAGERRATNVSEHRNVYVEPCAYEADKKRGMSPDSTIFCKFQLTLSGQNPDGSRTAPSGRADLRGAAAASHEGCSRRHGGGCVMISWHIERGSVCIHSTEPLGSRVGSSHHHCLKSTKAIETSYS
jgi:hypothetical protein